MERRPSTSTAASCSIDAFEVIGFAPSREVQAMAALDMQIRLHGLQTERALASIEGLAGNSAYMADLENEIVATHLAFVGEAVTEIATLRGLLSGRQVG